MAAIKSGGAAGPAQFGGGGPGVGALFLGGGAQDGLGDLGVDAVAQAGVEGFFHAAVFAGMESEDGHAPAEFEAGGEVAQKTVEGGKLVVHGDADGLEDAADGEVGFVLADVGQGSADGTGEFAGGGVMFFREERGELGGAGLVGIVDEEFGEFGGLEFLEEGGGGLAAAGVHAHVEGAVELHGEAAGRVIDLHGGDAEVGENEVGGGDLLAGEGLGEPGEIAADGGEDIGSEAEFAQAGLGLGEFDGVGVEADQPAAGLKAREEFPRVTAEAEGAINGDLAGGGGEDRQNLGDHDGAVGAGGSFAGGDDFGDGRWIDRGVEFLVFLLEAARIFAAVAWPALVRDGGSGGRGGIIW